MQTIFSLANECSSLTINFHMPQDWHEFGDKQLSYVYELIAAEHSTHVIMTLCLLRWSDTKNCRPSGQRLISSEKRKNPF